MHHINNKHISDDTMSHQIVFCHDEVTKLKHFPRYRPFVRGIHWSPVNSTHKGQWRGALMFSLICALNKRLSKQSWGWWFETLLCSLWRHCNVSQLTVSKDDCSIWYHRAHFNIHMMHFHYVKANYWDNAIDISSYFHNGNSYIGVNLIISPTLRALY